MPSEIQLLLMIVGMHLLGLAAVTVLMVLAFREGPGETDWPWKQGSDEGWGNKPRRPIEPADRPRGGIPLPDADPATVRLRDHRKLGDALPRPERRPVREPERTPRREPARSHGEQAPSPRRQ
jgi:hypothetical protein